MQKICKKEKGEKEGEEESEEESVQTEFDHEGILYRINTEGRCGNQSKIDKDAYYNISAKKFPSDPELNKKMRKMQEICKENKRKHSKKRRGRSRGRR